MRILVQCPGCNRQMELDVQSLDRRLRCPSCGRLFKVPDAQQLERAMKVAEQAGKSVFIDENGRVYG
jgi:transposase-like protein